MFYLNEITLLGRATKDAVLKNVGKDSKVTVFRLVSNRRIKRRDGEFIEKPTYVDCEVWGLRAEYAQERVKRGTPVLVKGQLETDEWTTDDGQKRSKLKIYCNSVQAERPRDEQRPRDEPNDSGQAVTAGATNSSDDVPF